MSEVIVVIGEPPGQIGQAIARRFGVGKHVILADLREENSAGGCKGHNFLIPAPGILPNEELVVTL